MAEHPQIPMHNHLLRSQVLGKPTSSVSYASVTLNLYWDVSSNTGSLQDDSDYEFQIFEVHAANTGNWVRTILDHTGTVTASDSYDTTAPGTAILSTTLSLNESSSIYYVTRGSYVNSSGEWSMATGIDMSSAPEGNNFYVSQTAEYSDFSGSSETDIYTRSPTGGSGFPSARYDTDLATVYEFQPSHNGSVGDPIWIWIAAM